MGRKLYSNRVAAKVWTTTVRTEFVTDIKSAPLVIFWNIRNRNDRLDVIKALQKAHTSMTEQEDQQALKKAQAERADFKFAIGQKVRVEHPNCGTWEGKVIWRASAGDDNEYEVENAPPLFPGSEGKVLTWEGEMTALEGDSNG